MEKGKRLKAEQAARPEKNQGWSADNGQETVYGGFGGVTARGVRRISALDDDGDNLSPRQNHAVSKLQRLLEQDESLRFELDTVCNYVDGEKDHQAMCKALKRRGIDPASLDL